MVLPVLPVGHLHNLLRMQDKVFAVSVLLNLVRADMLQKLETAPQHLLVLVAFHSNYLRGGKLLILVIQSVFHVLVPLTIRVKEENQGLPVLVEELIPHGQQHIFVFDKKGA